MSGRLQRRVPDIKAPSGLPRRAGLFFGADTIFKQRSRHCEPPDRADARPMTGSAKKSSLPSKDRRNGLLRCARN